MLKIKSDIKHLLSKMVSQFSKSNYDDRWSSIEIKYHDSELYLIGGGAGMIIVIKVDVEGTSNDFTGMVDLRRFFETLKFMGKDISISLGSKITLEKSGRKVIFAIQQHTFDNILPHSIESIMGNKDGVKMELYPEYLNSLTEFTSEDYDLRPSLTGIYVSTVNGKTSYAATDGFHIIEIYTKMKEVEPFIINPDVPFSFDEDIYVQKIKNHIVYSSDSWSVYQNIINFNEYPDYRRILSNLYGEWKTFSVNRRDMIYTLKAAVGFAGGSKKASINFQIDGNVLNMTSKNQENTGQDIYTDKIKITNMDNIDLEVAFLAKYFLDGIVASSEEEILLNVAINDFIFISENDRRIALLPIKKY